MNESYETCATRGCECNQATQVRRLEARVGELEKSLDEVLEQRDEREDQVSEIAAILVPGMEWTSETDLGVESIEAAAALRARVSELEGQMGDLRSALLMVRHWDFLNPPPSGGADWRVMAPMIDRLLPPTSPRSDENAGAGGGGEK